jgi:hypothetical protein
MVACAGSQLPDRAPSEAAAAAAAAAADAWSAAAAAADAWSAGAVSGYCDARRQVNRLGGVAMKPVYDCVCCAIHRWPCTARGAAAGRFSLGSRGPTPLRCRFRVVSGPFRRLSMSSGRNKCCQSMHLYRGHPTKVVVLVADEYYQSSSRSPGPKLRESKISPVFIDGTQRKRCRKV